MYSGTVQQHMPDSVTAVATEGTVCMYVCMYVQHLTATSKIHFFSEKMNKFCCTARTFTDCQR